MRHRINPEDRADQLRRLREMPDWDDPDDVALPLPYDRAGRFPPGRRRDGGWDKYFVGEVTLPISSLLVWQPTVGRNGVIGYLAASAYEPIVVVRQRYGRLIVADGHHRLMARYVRGARKVRALLYSMR